MIEKNRFRFRTSSGKWKTLTFAASQDVMDLSNQDITKIDLAPIEGWSNLKYIYLQNNELKDVDLDPLCSLSSLMVLDLERNNFADLNITPLFFCKSLTRFSIDQNVRCIVEPPALFTPANMALFKYWTVIDILDNYDAFADNGLWINLIKRTRNLFYRLHPEDWFSAQRGFLNGLGMKEIAAFDGDPFRILETLPENGTFQSIKENIYERVISLLEEQITAGGSTHFLEVDDLILTSGAVLISQIIEARKKEMKNLSVVVSDGKADARSIWFTVYGQKIMKQLGYGPYPNNSVTLTQILNALKGVHLAPKIVRGSHRTLKPSWEHFSPGLKNHLEMLGRGHSLVASHSDESSWQI